jgi:hypothetical protein
MIFQWIFPKSDRIKETLVNYSGDKGNNMTRIVNMASGYKITRSLKKKKRKNIQKESGRNDKGDC